MVSRLKVIMFAILVSMFMVYSVHAQVDGFNEVVDLSHWNANVNFSRAFADGLRGVMHKATQGLKYIDDKYNSRKIQALPYGIKWGAYHFADGTSGVDQANHFLKVVGEDMDTLLALDIEENPSGSSVTLQIAEDFVRTVYQARGRYPMVYGSAYLKDMVKNKRTVLLDCPLWIAQWASRPVIPNNTWSNWTMWQYTDGQVGPKPHSVDGIGNCDRDTVNSAGYRSLGHMWNTAGYTTY